MARTASYKRRRAAKRRAYRAANKEKIAAQSRVYYAENRDRIIAKSSAYYFANKEKDRTKLQERNKAYYLANKEKRAAQQRAYRAANKEKCAAKSRDYYMANKERITERNKNKGGHRTECTECIYFLRDTCNGTIKIGQTTKTAESRRSAVQIGNPNPIELFGIVPCSSSKAVEVRWHERFAAARTRKRGEWFHATPELLEAIKTAIATGTP